MNLSDPIYTSEDAAREHLENVRWPDGPFCPHCGTVGNCTKLRGKSTRAGVYKCNACRKPFSVTVGTLYERSKIPLHKWIMATHLLCASKKGISSHQLHRMLGVTYKTAWFMSHRIREAMRELHPDPLGGPGKIVEADETYWGGPQKADVFVSGKGWVSRPAKKQPRGYAHKEKVLTLVERGGMARSYHVPEVTAATLRPILTSQVRRTSHLMTDEAQYYVKTGKEFAGHETVNHSIDEYVRGDVSTNAVENYYSIFERGLTGVYQHVSAKHLRRYVGEFDFRYNHRIALGLDDAQHTDAALKGIWGKRLTYRRVNWGKARKAPLHSR